MGFEEMVHTDIGSIRMEWEQSSSTRDMASSVLASLSPRYFFLFTFLLISSFFQFPIAIYTRPRAHVMLMLLKYI